ncbi:MAG: cold shock domain-containing protein [Prolixibacteraceae bacterium]|nr:cold shock domain-containing protein [Prolixibacteraceae bacterium]
MGRSQETFNKKEVRNKKEKKRKEKVLKKQARKEKEKKSSLDDMIAYVDENGIITSTRPDPDKRTKVDASEIETSIPKGLISSQRTNEHTGTVTFFNESKGFGFIRDKDTGQSVFVHASNMLEPVIENDLVVFETTKGPKGLTAVNVKHVEK